ncbi:MAG: hypothetical protein Q9203_002769 [Teloschistes exilis]
MQLFCGFSIVIFSSFLSFVYRGASISIVTQSCTTSLGENVVNPVPTSSYPFIQTQTAYYTETVTPTSTVQPRPVTVTAPSTRLSTVTRTVANADVNTVTQTNTAVATVSVTNVVTITAAASSKVQITPAPTSTVTIPTSPGFIPASSAPYLRKRSVVISKRANVLAGKRPVERRKPKNNPQTVYCGVLLDCITTLTRTVTASRTATVTANPSTVTQPSPFTSTVTSSVLASPSTITITRTVTNTATSAIPQTTTITTTGRLTVTATPPIATFYASCDTDSLLNNEPNDGGAMFTASVFDYYGRLVTNPANFPYNCCVACITDPSNCSGGVFDENGVCTLVFAEDGTCSPDYGFVDIYGEGGDGPGTVTAFDGNCGAVAGS